MRQARSFGASTGVLATLAALVLLVATPGVLGATPESRSAATSAGGYVAPAFPSFYSGTFAARAGFAGSVPNGVVDVEPAQGSMLVQITFRASDPSFFAEPAAGTPAMSLAAIGARWGLPVAEYESAQSYFEARGLRVVHTTPDRLSLTVGGPVAAVDGAFGTVLDQGVDGDRAVEFPATPPALPTTLENEVASVAGLASGFDQFSFPLSPLTPAASPSQGGGNLVTPAVARQIYDLSDLYNLSGASSSSSSGLAIALLLWGWGYDPNDISTFFANDYPSSFPAVSWTPYPVDGAPAPSANAVNDPSKAPQELTLDLEWSGSIAPGASLDAVYAPDGPASDGYSPTDATMIDALNTAIGLPNVRAVSMSFGTAESTSSGLAGAFETAFAAASHHGVSLFAATGDQGGDQTACNGVVSPEYPSTSTYVVAVGGTNPSLTRNLLGQVTGFSESAWADSGGGFSDVYGAPSWQEVGSAAAPIEANGHRGTPDVSAAAADNYVYYDGQDDAGGGTSFATPLWAGLVVQMEAAHGSEIPSIDPRLYAVGAAEPTHRLGDGLVDITSGANCLGSATTGWDTATGWGSPRAVLLYEDLTATFVNLSVAASPSPVAPGESLQVTATLHNETTGQPIGNAPIQVAVDADTSIGPCVGTFGSATLESNASGTVVLTVPIPVCYLGSHAVASVTITSDGYYGTNATTVAVNLLGFVPALGFLTSAPYNYAAFVGIMAIAIAIGTVLGRRPRRTVGPPAGAVHPAPGGGAPGPSGSPTVPEAPGPEPSPPAPPPEPAGYTTPTGPPSTWPPEPGTVPPAEDAEIPQNP